MTRSAKNLERFDPESEVVARESERFLMAQCLVGDDVRTFLDSDAGEYLKGVAMQDIGEAVRTFLGAVDLNRSAEQIARAHSKANRARQSFQWMLEAIAQGGAAEYQLEQMDALDGELTPDQLEELQQRRAE